MIDYTNKILRLAARRILRAVVFCLAIVAMCAGGAMADVTYVYQGSAFTDFAGSYSCPGVCGISGSFVLGGPIGPDQTVFGISPVSFSFTDGNTTFNSSNSIFGNLGFITGNNGNIQEWSFGVFLGTTDQVPQFLQSVNLGPGQILDFSGNSNTGSAGLTNTSGSWNVVSTPEPSSLFLLGAGLVGLIGARNRKPVRSARTKSQGDPVLQRGNALSHGESTIV